jgi:formylglycine-generating enzyme required for sulfatase activity
MRVAHLQTIQPEAPPSERPVVSDMVHIQGGTFTMGSPPNEPKRNKNEGPQRQITISSFYMSKYEVTQKEYQDIMKTYPSKFNGDNLPVEQVTWYDAVEYCNKRSQREGLTPAYIINKGQKDPNNKTNYDNIKWTVTWNRNANGYRLPTEAEWEYACRAGTSTAYNTGATINGDTGWYKVNSYKATSPVGQKPANAWGLYDMHGNVLEWCWDWFAEYLRTTQTDPQGEVSGISRVLRGGSWDDSAVNIRSAYRWDKHPSYKNSSVGFRVARNGQSASISALEVHPAPTPVSTVQLVPASAPQEKDTQARAATSTTARRIVNLGAFSLKLNDNFQYGNDYQGKLTDKRLFDGHKIAPGESYRLKITYTASRDLEEDLMLGLVDTTPAAQYWKALSWPGEGGSMAEIPKSKAGEVVSATITFNTLAAATGISGSANALVFLTNGEGKKGKANSGKQKAVTLNFTEFIFTQE